MKQIIVYDENAKPQYIDAGVSQYSELTDSPIKINYKGVSLVNSIPYIGVPADAPESQPTLLLKTVEDHKWTEEELLLFCQNAEQGRYDIITEEGGVEFLIIDKTDANIGDRYRRIGMLQDQVYDIDAGWIVITDKNAKQLIFKIQNLNDIPSQIVVGNSVVLNCYYYSTLGIGTLQVKKNGAHILSFNLRSGEVTQVNLSNYIEDGTNSFILEVTNESNSGPNGKPFLQSVDINAVNITYSPTFNELAPKENDVNFAFSYSGTGDKYINITTINNEGIQNIIKVPTKYVNSGTAGYVIPAKYFSHGQNTLSTFMYMKDSAGHILTRTDDIKYTFPYLTSADPVVMTYFDYNKLQAWDTIAIPYYVWSKDISSNRISSIKFELSYEQETDDGIISKTVVQKYDDSNESNITNYLTYNTEHKWQLTNVPYGTLQFKIYINGSEIPSFTKDNVIVAESEFNFNTVGGYIYNFAANDVVSTDPFVDWENNGYTLTLHGFNWQNDGIVTEGNKSLKFSPASYATADNINLFKFLQGNDPPGFTLEVDFEVDATAVNSEPIITYTDKSVRANDKKTGIFIYPSHALINYDANALAPEQVRIDYQKGERKNITFVFQKPIADGTAFLMVYIDGIVSKVLHYSSTNFINCNNFIFNQSGNIFKLFATRAYAAPLSSTQVLQNYISNFASAEEKTQLLTNNNIYNTGKDLTYTVKQPGTGKMETRSIAGESIVDFDKVKNAGLIGCMVILMDKLPELKKPYLNCHTFYYEKDPANPEVEWDSKNNRSMATTYYYVQGENGKMVLNEPIRIGAQGTSSLRYPRKNFKFKFNDKFYIKNHTKGKDKTFTFKIDYMDSSGANNITNAQIMQNGLIKEDWPGTPLQDNARLNLDGFPVLLFWANKMVDGQPKYVHYSDTGAELIDSPRYEGIANFNYDKKAKKLLGWDEDTFQGFEFRSNTGSVCLQRGIPNMINFKHGSQGYEWRWTYISDIADDFYDKKLERTMNGGYFDEDGGEYTEQEYLESRWKTEAIPLKPYNAYYIHREDGDYQVFRKSAEKPTDYETATPVNYMSFNLHPKLDIFGLEYGVRFAKDGSLIYQLPYGVSYDEEGKPKNFDQLYTTYTAVDQTDRPYVIDKQGKYRALEDLPLYPTTDVNSPNYGKVDISGNEEDPFGTGEDPLFTPEYVDPDTLQKYEAKSEGYYKYSRNPEHCAYFEYNDEPEYFRNEKNWKILCDGQELIGKKITFVLNPEAVEPYVLDDDGRHHLLANYKPREDGYINTGEDKWVDPATLDKFEKHVDYIDDIVGFKFEPLGPDDLNVPYIKDNLGEYRKLSEYPRNPKNLQEIDISGNTKQNVSQYDPVYVLESSVAKYKDVADKIKTFDFMCEIYKYWFYAVDTLSHCNKDNYKRLICRGDRDGSDVGIDTYADELGDNGYPLFRYSALLDYYCLSLFTGLCDNFAKNTFVHSYDGGKTWSHAWYDMDTCFGLNNSGAYVYNYDIDFKDPATFNGSNSTLWSYLYDLCMEDIKYKYRQLRDLGEIENSVGGIGYKKVMDVVYDQNIAYKTEAMYNSSAFWRYIVPDYEGHSGTELPAAQGSRLSLLKYWNSNREIFLDSKYGSNKYSGDTIVLRMFANKDIHWDLVPDTNMYLGLSFDAADSSMPTLRSPKVFANTHWKHTQVIKNEEQDKNTYIYGASHLLEVGGLSETVSKAVNLTPAFNLRSIVLGTDDPEILRRQDEVLQVQKMIITLPTQPCKNLTEIDLHNCKYARIGNVSGTTLDVSAIAPSLEKVDIRGTELNSVVVAPFCPLQEIDYSDYITVVSLQDLLKLQTVNLYNTEHISKIELKNTPLLDQLAFITRFQGKVIDISVDNLHCDEADALSMTYLDWLVDVNAQITGGNIYVMAIDDKFLQPYRAKWPNLTINLKKIYPKDAIFGVIGEGE